MVRPSPCEKFCRSARLHRLANLIVIVTSTIATTDIIFASITTTTTTTVIPACSGINDLQPYSSLCGKRPETTTRKICSEEADENVRTPRWRVEHMQIRFHKTTTTTNTISLHDTSE
jgi:hypothetical protein